MTAALFFAATLAIPLALGLPLVRLGSLHDLRWPARAAIAWSGGTVVLSVLLTVLSAVGIAWRPWIVLSAAAAAIAIALRRKAPPGGAPTCEPRTEWPTVIAAALCVAVAVAGLFQFAAGAATSADLSYVWGAKAVHFAVDRGMDFRWMQQPHLIHLHPNYPPLWPVSLAWGASVAGSLPWSLAPIVTWIYLVAAAVIVHGLLRRPIGRRNAALVGCLWFAVVTGSAVSSHSGGSAEGPLLLFVTVTVTALTVEERDDPPKLRWLAAGALAGAVLTKSEGVVAALLVITGTAIRDGLWRRAGVLGATARLAAPALAAAGSWAVIRIAHGLPLTDPIREMAFEVGFGHLGVIFKVCARLLGSGILAVGWLAPLAAAVISKPLLPLRAVPGLLVVAGLPAFAFVYYLHASGNPVELIVWTFPRLIQPAISAWIVCAGLVAFAQPTPQTGRAG